MLSQGCGSVRALTDVAPLIGLMKVMVGEQKKVSPEKWMDVGKIAKVLAKRQRVIA